MGPALLHVSDAYREAFEIVTGSHAVMMSADLETPPEVIPDFLRLSKDYPSGIIAGSRWIGDATFAGYSKIKWVCNWIFQKLIGGLFLSRNTDLTYAYRIFPVKLLQAINWQEIKHPFFLETALVPLRLGVSMIEIPVSWKARTEGDSVNSFWANFRYFKTALRVRFAKIKNLITR